MDTGNFLELENKGVVFDLEADGLYEEATQCWIGVFYDMETEEEHIFEPNQMEEMLEYIDNTPILVGHNIIGFDIPLLKKLFDFEYKGILVDTFILSSLSFPDRIGGHSVDNWGKIFGHPKVEHEDWSKYTPEMKKRCRVDVQIQVKIYQHLFSELQPITHTGIDWDEAIKYEHLFGKQLAKQEYTGVPFNTPLAKEYLIRLTNDLKDIESEVDNILGVLPVKGSVIRTIFLKTGAYRKHVVDWFTPEYIENRVISGPYCKIEFKQIKPSMYAAVKERYIQLGWKPTYYTEKGSPKAPTADELEEFANQSGLEQLKVIARYGSIANRRNILRKWIQVAEIHNRNSLPAGGFSIGTNTMRLRHTTVVNVPRATSKDGELVYAPDYQPSFFGTEMRSLFYSPDKDYKMVGYDAAGLELRCLAHYLNNQAFTDTVLDGDIHTMLWDATGRDMVASRSDQKTISYSWLYGAGDPKIGEGCTALPESQRDAKAGAKARSNLLTNIDGLGNLIDLVTKASGRGYLRGIDGRKIFMRKSKGKVQTHKALNTLLQSTGAIIMKHFHVTLEGLITHLDAVKVLDMHDEAEQIVHKDDVEEFCRLVDVAIDITWKHFEFNIPLAMDTQVGNTWAEVH